MRRPLLRGHKAHRKGHTMNPMREFLLVAPKRPDIPIHHGDILQTDDVQSVDDIAHAQSVV